MVNDDFFFFFFYCNYISGFTCSLLSALPSVLDDSLEFLFFSEEWNDNEQKNNTMTEK